jgi:hypothetical protein
VSLSSALYSRNQLTQTSRRLEMIGGAQAASLLVSAASRNIFCSGSGACPESVERVSRKL